MADRISNDHPSVRTVRSTCVETATGVRLEIPDTDYDVFSADDVVRVVVDGNEGFATVERALTGSDRWIRGIYETPSQARDPGGARNLLSTWIDDHGVIAGGSVLIDVIEPDFLYGLRKPGSSAYYDAYEPPNEGLRDIARSLEDDR